ncbi:ribosomal protein S12 methylthiotransferase RimO [Ruminococcus sp. CAG:488]|nr:30S ribosomal protein S12 methylthiotransferase RimO [Oscillospiraceae bacterium]CDA20467.1 ribosomal protein S12 methylthiotransferase RimO [Ruminococcus sp. CAG:488]
MNYKIGMISLGCPKNQVDAEHMLALMDAEGWEIVDYVDGCDAVIVNTCGFIDDAKKEAIENILDMVELKKEGVISKIIVTGCLAQRYKDEIVKEIPEVDAVIGIGANGDIIKTVEEVMSGVDTIEKYPPQCELPLEGQRILTTPQYWAYLKIGEGCSNRCTYCTIPSIRGNMRSRSMENVIDEAKQLAESGVKELILIAQDTTSYGLDLYGELKLPELLNELCKIDSIEWIRLLYCYPDRITDELIETMKNQEKVVNYIDLPLQHADDKILKAMNRRGDQALIRNVISKLREEIPDVVIRTTFIVGFPGEGEEEFETLAEFVNEIEFDRLGVFTFSPQEGTPAFDMEDQVDEDIKTRRGEVIMQDQYSIMEEKNNEKIGKTYRVVVEDYDGYSDSYTGRTYMDAPEIDGLVKFTSHKDLDIGDFVDVEIFDVEDYDLIGEVTA